MTLVQVDRQGIEKLARSLMAAQGCHTVILYGSWARGEATRDSDVDLFGVREHEPSVRDARVVDGIYIDAFIESEATLKAPDASLLQILGGVVLFERDGFGSALLARLAELRDRGPAALSDDERRARVLWSRKMVDRVRALPGPEGEYRRMQLLLAALEDYFVLRSVWYRGPKEALAWLRQHDASAYEHFGRATTPTGDERGLTDLVDAVYGPRED